MTSRGFPPPLFIEIQRDSHSLSGASHDFVGLTGEDRDLLPGSPAGGPAPSLPQPAMGAAVKAGKPACGPAAAAAVPPDGGWGWVVLAAAFLTMSLSLPVPQTLGVFFAALQEEFSASAGATAWVPACMTATLHAAGPISSALVSRVGCRPAVMLGGILTSLGLVLASLTTSIAQLYGAAILSGLGICLCFQPALTILGHYFSRRRSLANGVASSGTAVGLCLLPLASQALLARYGWRGAFLVLGSLILNCCACAALMRPLGPARPAAAPRRRSEGRRGEADPDAARDEILVRNGERRGAAGRLSRAAAAADLDLFAEPLYAVFASGTTVMVLGFFVPLIFLVPYALSMGMSDGQAAGLLAVNGLINIFGRPVAGWVGGTRMFRGRSVYLYSGAALLSGLNDLLCGLLSGRGALLAFCVCHGVAASVIGGLVFTVIGESIPAEGRRFSAALGLFTVLEIVSFLVGPPAAGLLVDCTGDYGVVFVTCGVIVMAAALFMSVGTYCVRRRRAARSDGTERGAEHSTGPDAENTCGTGHDTERGTGHGTEHGTENDTEHDTEHGKEHDPAAGNGAAHREDAEPVA